MSAVQHCRAHTLRREPCCHLPPRPCVPRHQLNTRPCHGPDTTAHNSSRFPLGPRAARQPCSAPHAAAVDAASTVAPALPYWRCHVSQREPKLELAVEECIAGIAAQGPLPGRVDVAFVFVSSLYWAKYESLVDLLRQRVPGLRHVFGCTGYGIIGQDADGAHEVEDLPALSVTLASIPQAEVVVRHIGSGQLPDGDAPPNTWSDLLGVPAFPEQPLHFVVLADPQYEGTLELLAGLDFAFPEATKIGGLSSTAAIATRLGRRDTASWAWDAGRHGSSSSDSGSSSGLYLSGGASVLAIHGEVAMQLMIAQGCRPLTPHTWTIDKVSPVELNRIIALSCETVGGGRPLPALEAFQAELKEILSGMTEAKLRATVSNMAVGLAPDGLKQSLEAQDFLIRALLGFGNDGALLVGDRVRAGQRIRFMVRDREGAQQDLQSHGLAFKRRELQAMLAAVPSMPSAADGLTPALDSNTDTAPSNTPAAAPAPAAPFGMLMFSCNGRGSGLYGEPSYDARTMSSFVPVPCAGFQCNGEIGKVGNSTHLHGFTCAVGVLRMTGADQLCMAPSAGAGAVAGSGTGGNAARPPSAASQQSEQRDGQDGPSGSP